MQRNVLSLLPAALLFLPVTASAQPSPGFRIYGNTAATSVQMVDSRGVVVHTWTSAFRALGATRLLPDGTLLRDIAPPGNAITIAGVTGGIQRLALDGNVLWDYRHYGPGFSSHHDIKPMPNGNVLLIVWETKTAAEAVAAGRDPALLTGPVFLPDSIVEIRPTGPTSGVVVWEWHVWDHLVQDHDPLASNYGPVASHPELLDINFPPVALGNGDWNHLNGIDYDPLHDWIILSLREQCEVVIIDHSTTTAQAQSHAGGRWGHGGDFLYRWGNPAAYRAGSAADRILGFQHCPRFIPPGYPGAGNVTIFDNQHVPGASAVLEIVLPLDANENFVRDPSGRYGPSAPIWSFMAPTFYSAIVSSAQRLKNGNTLVCSGAQGLLFEVTPGGAVPWSYSPGNGIFQASYVEQTLWADGDAISVGNGGRVDWTLIAGSARASEMYLVLGSLSGTAPGIALGNVTVPLNLDTFFTVVMSSPNVGPFQRTLGLLDASGRATASFDVPPGLLPAELSGARMDFAYLTVDLQGLQLTSASNPTPVAIRP